MFMLKIIESNGFAANPEGTKGGFDSNNVVGNMVGGNKAPKPTKRKNLVKTTKSKILVKSKNNDFPKFRPEKTGTGFFTPKTRPAFTQLRQVFVKAPILHHFDLESHIRIETNA